MATRPTRTLSAVVMAAGKGVRLKSKTPKVLHPICGRPVLWHVLRAVDAVRPDRLIVVTGHGREQIEAAVRSWGLRSPLTFVDQGTPMGTGHAVLVAEKAVGRANDVLVVNGDEALVTTAWIRDLLRLHRRARPACTFQTTILPDATGFGRVVRDGDRLVKIAEGRRKTKDELAIREVVAGVYVFRREDAYRGLPALDRDNAKHEYLLTDLLTLLVDKGEDVRAVTHDYRGALGTNSRADLARAAAVMRWRINEALMDGGVTLVDPDRTYVDVGVKVGADSTILPMTFLEGDTTIGRGCTIGPSTRIVDTQVADGAEIQFSVVRGSKIGPGATVGPYASLRPGTVLKKGAKAGTFVEIKASTVGEGSKVPHLAYVGDATIGREVNVGAGTITCNYDGYEKHPTVIGDGAFIGSDTMLVAPVTVGRGAVTGAGSTITRDVPDGALAVERSEQRVVEGYAERRRKRARRGARKGEGS